MNALGYPDYLINGLIPFNSSVGGPSTNGSDAFGSYWSMDGEMVGWDGPDLRQTMLTKIGNTPAADGEIPSDLHYRGRTMTFTLYAQCTSEANREASRYLLMQALDLTTSTGTLTVNEEVPKFCTIVRAGNTGQGKLALTDMGLSRFEQQSYGEGGTVLWADAVAGTAVWPLRADIELYAPDPRKYSVAQTTTDLSGSGPSTLNIVNAGNTPSNNFIIDLADTGGGTGPIIITLGGLQMQLLVPTVPAGAPALNDIPGTLEIDFYNHTITSDVTNYYYLRSLLTSWLVAPIGTNALNINGTQTGNCVYRSAWI